MNQYRSHYDKLLQTPIPINVAEVKTEIEVEKKLHNAEKCCCFFQAQEITFDELDKVINEPQSNKAPDKGGIRNEYIKYGGEDLKRSLLDLLNEVLSGTSGTCPQ